MSLLLLDLTYLVLLIIGLPFVIWKTLTSERFRAGWGERFGAVPNLAAQHRIWVHCASVGEVLLARTLVARLESEFPGVDVVISTMTNTGRETAAAHLPGHTVFYFPLDFSPVVRRVFQRIRPTAVVLVELEMWSNFLVIARRRSVPVVVVNGRITERSVRTYRLFGPMARHHFDRVQHYAVQNEEYARRVETFGISRDRISVCGTMKYDTVATEVAPQVLDEYRSALRLRPDDSVIVAGCTHPGEDELLIDYLKQQAADKKLRLVLAPRHTKNAGAVERLIADAGLLPVRKTAIDAGKAPEGFEDRPHVILVDTTGELAHIYAVASVVFVGGSLVEHGGHNMIEPAALGKPVIVGPNTWNFADTVKLLLEGDAAVQIDDVEALPDALNRLTGDPLRCEQLGANARTLVEQSKGATDRNIEAIRSFLAAT